MKENKVRVVFEAFMDKFQKDVRAAAKATLEVGEAGAKGFRQANERVSQLETSLGRLQKALKAITVGYVGKKLFAAGTENLKELMDFQDGMKAVHTLLPHLTEQGLGEMSKQAKQFAKDMKLMPELITPALYEAISAGVPDEGAFDFLEDAQFAAKAGQTDFATSVDFLTNVINSYGAEAITATEASDAMFIGMRNGKISFDEMAAHMYSIVPDAANLGIEFNNIAAAAGRMGAMGTPIAQATTQLGAFVNELENTETGAGKVFYQATQKTVREFVAEGKNIQDIIMVMDAAAKKLDVEVSQLFGSKVAAKVVTSLAKVKDTFANDLYEIQNSAGATAEAYDKMGSTLSAVFDGIKSKIAVFKLDVGDNYLPQISEAANKVDESLDRLDKNGTLESLASSIAGAVITIINQFDNLLNNIDGIIEGIDNVASFIDNHLPRAIDIVWKLVGAFVVLKTAAAVSTVIEAVAGAIGVLTGAQWALNVAQNASPIGLIITLVGLLLLWIIKLASKYESFSDFLLVSYEVIKVEFYGLVGAFAWGFDSIARWIDNLIGWIPGIGEATGWVAEQTGRALDGLNGKIDESIAKINELNNKKIKSGAGITEPMTPEEEKAMLVNHRKGAGKVKQPQIEKPDVVVPDNLADMLKNSGKGKKTKAKKPKKTKPKTIRDRINDIQDKHDPDIDLYESRADLAKAKEDDKGVKQNKKSVIEVLKRQAADMLNLQLSSKGQDVKIVEAARNKVLVKIQDILKDINDGVSKMVGDFNKPSDLRLLTEYQYKVDKSDNTLLKRLVYSPDISMYLTIADTGKKGIAQVKDEINHFTGAIFDDKNDLVTQFMRDVTRN